MRLELHNKWEFAAVHQRRILLQIHIYFALQCGRLGFLWSLAWQSNSKRLHLLSKASVTGAALPVCGLPRLPGLISSGIADDTSQPSVSQIQDEDCDFSQFARQNFGDTLSHISFHHLKSLHSSVLLCFFNIILTTKQFLEACGAPASDVLMPGCFICKNLIF